MRTEFGMSAHEAWVETPAWELEALVRERNAEIAQGEREARR